MKITRLRIVNYRGIQALDEQISSGGAVISGPNARGKTSCLRALAAALSAQDVGPDAIRLGADRAEILVDLEAFRVRRLITRKGTSLTVSTATDAGEAEMKRPQSMLNELLGAGGIDPLRLYLADEKERRQIVLAAIPTRITPEQVQRWTSDGAYWLAETGLHVESAPGLEAIRVLRSAAYDRRATANKAAKEARQKADEAARDLPVVRDAPPVGEAEEAARVADRELERLQVQQASAEGAHKAGQATRDRAAGLRQQATQIMSAAPDPVSGDVYQLALDEHVRADERVKDLKVRLAAAEGDLAATRAKTVGLEDAMRRFEQTGAEARALNVRAAELESAIPPVVEVPAAAIAAAQAALERARAQAQAARETHEARGRHEIARAALVVAEAAAAHAAKLDAIVETLTREAPAELAQAEGGIPGLAFTDSGIELDGVAIDKLSGAEQMGLAIEIAKRVAGRARILVCDGLERLDPQTYDHFVRRAIEGGFQLLGTRVSDGDLTIHGIGDDDAADGRAA